MSDRVDPNGETGTAATKDIARPTGPKPSRGKPTSVLTHAILLVSVFCLMLPLYFVISTALKTRDDYSADKIGLPDTLFTGNFTTALRGGTFFLWLGNSVILTVGAVVLSLVVSSLAAFAFARMRFFGSNMLLAAVTALMVIPPIVMLVPLFLMLARVYLIGTYPGAILVYAGLVTPFSVYFLTNFFRSIPHEIVEAAFIDGATSLGVLLRILLPLSGPALATLVVVNSVYVWNDLLVALVLLPEEEMYPLMIGITIFGSRYNTDVPVAMAGMLLASIPMLLLYLAGQRLFIRGIVAGALKG